MVCDESNARPIDGSATLATDRFRLATAAITISAVSTRPERAGAWPAVAAVFGSSVSARMLASSAGKTALTSRLKAAPRIARRG
jgi:hypothetical protein